MKLIIFDLDGVLVDSTEIHYHTLNRALESLSFKPISRENHLSTFNGLSTKRKLELMPHIPTQYYNDIWRKKQEYTKEYLQNFKRDDRLCDLLASLKQHGYIIHVASNCIYESVKLTLQNKGFLTYVDYFISNEDVLRCKPFPEIYQRCMIRAGVGCQDTVIVEDSDIGKQAAIASGARLISVNSPDDVKLELFGIPTSLPTFKYNVVIPMAGEGSRFKTAGYSFPKPFIDVKGKPMIQIVVENLNLSPENTQFIFIIRKQHLAEYNASYLLNLIAPNCIVIETDGLTEGAACSILLAKNHINNNAPLILANSDQYVVWNSNEFLNSMLESDADGGIATFQNTHPKWSYAMVDNNGFVLQVAEKKPISTNATAGIYYWKHGSDFVKYAEQMIAKNIRVNNEFYTCPVYNEAIQNGLRVKIYEIQKMYGLGVPEDLEYFIKQGINV